MKRRGTWIMLAPFVAVAAVIAWRLTSDSEQLEQPAPSSVMELANRDTPTTVNASRQTSQATSASNAAFLPLRARTTSAIPNPVTPSPTMPAPPPPSASAPIASAVAPDNFIVTTQAMPRVPSPDARPLPINPITGEPEREIIGIGAVLAKDDEGLRIRDVLPGSPAALANLSGCVIQTVDGVNVANLSMNECVLLIRGLEGSAVKLEVVDPAQQRQTIEIVRNKVRL